MFSDFFFNQINEIIFKKKISKTFDEIYNRNEFFS